MVEATWWQVEDLPHRIAARIKVNPDTGCWIYGKGIPNHYASIQLGRQRRPAHRVVYELLIGPIPHGLVIDHVKLRGCLGYRCVCPAHLEAVTPAENSRRNVKLREGFAPELAVIGDSAAPAADEAEPVEVVPGGGWSPIQLRGVDVLTMIWQL